MAAPGIDFASQLNQLVDAGDIEHALAFTRFIVDHVRHDPAATSLVLGSPALDKLCARIGATTLAQLRQHGLPTAADAPADVIILATELYALGGHSRVIEDFIRAQPHKRHLLMLTDFFGSADDNALSVFRAVGVDVQRAPAGSRLDKLLWTQMALARHPQAQVFLFNHHADAVAIAAVQPGLNREVLFCHHGDHNLCLGVHLPHARHIDFFAPFQHACAARGCPAEYWPLSVPDGGARTPDTTRHALRTCSSGSWSKFDQPFAFHYAELVAPILQTTGGSHLHIGDLPDAVRAEIAASLQSAGIAADRFSHLPRVPSLWQALLDESVDLYIGSFPIGGGRALIEALGAGIPVITFRHPVSPMLGTTGLGPADSWSWAQPDELLQILGEATPEALARRGQQARAHYLQHHAPDTLRACIAGERIVTPPPFAAQRGDDLGAYLLRALGRDEQIAPVLDKLAELARSARPPAPPTNALADAIALFNAAKFEEAYAALMPLLESDPVEPRALIYLGLIALKSNLPDDAAIFFDHARTLSGNAVGTQAQIEALCRQHGLAPACTASAPQRTRIAFLIARLDHTSPTAALQRLLCELDAEVFETLLFIDGVADSAAAQRFVLIADRCQPLALNDADAASAAIRAQRPDVIVAIDPRHQQLPGGLAAQEFSWAQLATLPDTAAVERLLSSAEAAA